MPYLLKTGLDLTEAEFNGAMQERALKGLRDAKIWLDAKKAKVDGILKHMDVFTFQKLSDAYYGKLKEATDIYPFFEQYISDLKGEDRLKTASGYQTAMNSFQKFDKKVGFYEITSDWLNRYHRWMLEAEQGNSDTTVGIYTRYLRSIFNYAISQKVINRDEHYPFGKRRFVIPASRNIKKALSAQEVSKIHRYETIPGSPEDKARDFWMFSYLCNGINFKDIAHLKNKNLDGDMLKFVRAKTKNTSKANQSVISSYLNAPAITILKKWRSDLRGPDDYVFDILAEGEDSQTQLDKVAQFIKITNKYLKRISRSLELDKVVTTYFSRHSAATILKKSGASVEQIREVLGHQSTSTTQKYLDSFDDETKRQLSESLTQGL